MNKILIYLTGKYYWHCPVCNKKRSLLTHATSLQGAREKLERHEAKYHKGKQVGSFGRKFGKCFVYQDKATGIKGIVLKRNKPDKAQCFYTMYTWENKKIRKIRFAYSYISKWLKPVRFLK